MNSDLVKVLFLIELYINNISISVQCPSSILKVSAHSPHFIKLSTLAIISIFYNVYTTLVISNSDSPFILNLSDFNESFKSVYNDDSLHIPMNDFDGSVNSNNSKAVTFWKKWLGIFTLLLILVGLISVIICLSLKVK